MIKLLLLLPLAVLPACANATVSETEKVCTPDSKTIVLERTKEANKFGNPIWTLTLPNCSTYDTVSGRSSTQELDRNTANNQSPLPKGEYFVGAVNVGPFGPSSNPELGNTFFVDLFPRFETERTDLGIHWDPSFNKDEVEDGTAGCVALTNAEDLKVVTEFIQLNRIDRLEVRN